MVPLHFGTSDRILFGIYSPASGRPGGRGVLLCNPWGPEAMRAHRSMKVLADRLSAQGLDVLRFDYYGTGDSFGDATNACLADWVGDAVLAAEELRALAGVGRVDLVGLRLGAWVAAAAAARLGGEGGRIVLWDPVVREMEKPAAVEGLTGGGGTAPDGVELGGFFLPEPFQAELESLSFQGLPGPGWGVLTLFSQETEAEFLDGLEAGEVSTRVVPSLRCWVEERDFGAGAVPVHILETITAWLK